MQATCQFCHFVEFVLYLEGFIGQCISFSGTNIIFEQGGASEQKRQNVFTEKQKVKKSLKCTVKDKYLCWADNEL